MLSSKHIINHRETQGKKSIILDYMDEQKKLIKLKFKKII